MFGQNLQVSNKHGTPYRLHLCSTCIQNSVTLKFMLLLYVALSSTHLVLECIRCHQIKGKLKMEVFSQ